MAEVSRPVIAIVLVLNAVFLPVAFLGGLVGEMYRQFAITIAVSVTISGFVALTLTPAMCALLLQDRRGRAARHPARTSTPAFVQLDAIATRDGVRLGDAARRRRRGASSCVMLLVDRGVLERATPSALAPEEDQGYVIAIAALPPAASLQRTHAVLAAARQGDVRAPGVSTTTSPSAGSTCSRTPSAPMPA